MALQGRSKSHARAPCTLAQPLSLSLSRSLSLSLSLPLSELSLLSLLLLLLLLLVLAVLLLLLRGGLLLGIGHRGEVHQVLLQPRLVPAYGRLHLSYCFTCLAQRWAAGPRTPGPPAGDLRSGSPGSPV